MITQKIQNRIRSAWTELRPVKATKVIGIGLPKTGTTTLGSCFRQFGFKPRTFDMNLAVQVKRNQTESVLKEAEKFETFEDWPWFAIYRELGQQFPQSKFVLTLRKDTETYVASLKGHHERQGIREPGFVKPYWWDEVFGGAGRLGLRKVSGAIRTAQSRSAGVFWGQSKQRSAGGVLGTWRWLATVESILE